MACNIIPRHAKSFANEKLFFHSRSRSTCLSAVLYLDLCVKANHELALVALLETDLSDVASSL